MSTLTLSIVATGLVGLASCIPPSAPPPQFRPIPRSSRDYENPYDTGRDAFSNLAPDDYSGQGRDAYSGQGRDAFSNSSTPPRSPAAPTAPGTYPAAERTANSNQVISPYEPYNVIDVEGFKTGQLARDPSNQKIFRIP